MATIGDTIYYTHYKYNSTTQAWDILYAKTSASQVIQTTNKVFLDPTVNTINGIAFGSIINNIWTPSAITLYGSNIAVTNAQGSETIAAAISRIDTNVGKAITSDNNFTETDKIILTNSTSGRKGKSSGIGISNLQTASAWTSFPPTDIAKYVPTIESIQNFPGSGQISTVGTITSGTWNGSNVDVAHGGTGASDAASARTNLGLGTAATHNTTANGSDITNATSASTELPTVYAVQQYAATIRLVYTVAWSSYDYNSTTAPTATKLGQIPQGVTVYYNSGAQSATGTLSAGASQLNKIILIYSSNGTQDTFDEYICVADFISSGTIYKWEKIGHTDIDLSGYVKKGTITNNHIAISNGTDTIDANTYSIYTSWTTVEGGNYAVLTQSAIYNYLTAGYAGGTTISTVGTITSGTWQGNAIAASYIGNLPSSKINAMTGYSLPASYSAITTSDTLNQAIGKLERGHITNTTDITNLKARANIYWNTSLDNITDMQDGDYALIYS